MRFRIALLLALVGIGAATAFHSLQESPCVKFEKRLIEFYRNLMRGKPRTPRELKGMKQFLEEACAPPLHACGFKVCTEGAPGNQLAPWFEQDLSCDEFLREIKTRFTAGQKLSALPAEKRQELNEILALSCSPRFAHCNFSSCRNKSGGR